MSPVAPTLCDGWFNGNVEVRSRFDHWTRACAVVDFYFVVETIRGRFAEATAHPVHYVGVRVGVVIVTPQKRKKDYIVVIVIGDRSINDVSSHLMENSLAKSTRPRAFIRVVKDRVIVSS